MRNKRDDLRDATRRILYALNNHTSPYPMKRMYLAKAAGMSRPTLDRYLPMLADLGYVEYLPREPGVLLTGLGYAEWRRLSGKSTGVDNS